jgi:uncharacterized RDD family membrane protein YckC
MEFGGFWIRVAAYFIDSIIMLVLIGVLYFALTAVGLIDFAALSALADESSMQPGAELDPAVAMQAIGQVGIFYLGIFLVAWLYDALLTSSPMQATPGKMVLGLRVTTADGEPIGFGRATGRFFGKIISGMICNVGYLMVAFTSRKQGLHDMIANTVVVHA